MSDVAIKVENLSKKYTIGSGTSSSLRETIGNIWHNTFGGKRNDQKIFWALQNLNFEIKQGEAVGIIGRNGAGKSTLLKLLSKITHPTHGSITMNGRVSSLLEVGTGFHPELTGRENIYLNGTILGMSRKEVKSKFDEIVNFSEVEKFLDTPVKRYSSGMYVRLAFAVAAHLEPEILIIDEVLAVGDAEFQKKCLGKMGQVAKEGRTVLFVSHNMAAVNDLCTSGIMLKNGEILKTGSCSEVVSEYINSANKSDIKELKSNDHIRLENIKAFPIEGSYLSVSSGIRFEIDFNNYEEGYPLAITIEVRNSENSIIFHHGHWIEEIKSKKGLYSISIELDKYTINGGNYFVNLIFATSIHNVLLNANEVLSFQVNHETIAKNASPFPGALCPALKYKTRFSSAL